MNVNEEDIEKRKYALLKRAIEQARKQEDTLDELRSSAFEVLLLHPGCDFGKWLEILTRQYGTELIDAYGTDPDKIYSCLEKLWRTPYHDRASGLERDYKTWAEALSTEASVQMYYDMIRK